MIFASKLQFFYHYKKKWFSFDFKAMTWEDVKTMGRLCVPTSIQSIMPALSSAVMITFVNPFGLTALAGYGVVRNLELIMFMPTNAMSMAVTSIVGQCKGAGRIDRACPARSFHNPVSYMFLLMVYGELLVVIITPSRAEGSMQPAQLPDHGLHDALHVAGAHIR